MIFFIKIAIFNFLWRINMACPHHNTTHEEDLFPVVDETTDCAVDSDITA